MSHKWQGTDDELEYRVKCPACRASDTAYGRNGKHFIEHASDCRWMDAALDRKKHRNQTGR